MSKIQTIFLIYFCVISVISVIAVCYDKSASWKRGWRIPEKWLLILGAVGGALFMFVTMKLIRHKTRHSRFMLPLPLFIVAHALLAYLIYLKL